MNCATKLLLALCIGGSLSACGGSDSSYDIENESEPSVTPEVIEPEETTPTNPEVVDPETPDPTNPEVVAPEPEIPTPTEPEVVDPETPEPTEPEPSSYEVTAIDGYLQSARVWLDINYNFRLDSNEPSAQTGIGGRASLDTTGIENAQNYPVIVQAIEGITLDEDTITEDNPSGTPIEKGYMLTAPPGLEVITPLSSLVHLRLYQQGVDLADTESLQRNIEQMTQTLADEIGIPAQQVLGDFKLAGYKEASFAARNIVAAQVLPQDDESLQNLIHDSDTLSLFERQTESVNGLLKDAIEEAVENNTDLDVADVIIQAPESNQEFVDSDNDGVWDFIDAFPFDPDRTKPSQQLAYDTFFGGYQVKPSAESLADINDEQGVYTGQTSGESTWFYSPFPQTLVDAGYLLSAVADFSFMVGGTFSENNTAFTNIYAIPSSDAAYQRLSENPNVQANTSALIRDTNWNKDNPAQDVYVITIRDGYTLNQVMQETGVFKSDFRLLSFIDLPRDQDGDQEAVNANFILKLGDSRYVSSEDFSLDSYSFNPKISFNPEQDWVVANAVELAQDTSTQTVTAQSYGKRIWLYMPFSGKAYSSIGNLSEYKNLHFKSDTSSAFMNVYVVAKDTQNEDALISLAQANQASLRHVDWAKSYQPQGKEVFAINLTKNYPSLTSVMQALDLNFDDFDLISYVDGPQDGDLGAQGNFFFKNGGNESTSLDLNLQYLGY